MPRKYTTFPPLRPPRGREAPVVPASPGVATGLAISVAATCALGALCYGMPATFDNPAGVNLAGVRHFAESLGIAGAGALTVPQFAWSFRVLLVAAWAGYGVALVLAFSGRAPRARRTLPLIVAVSAAFALFCPPALSRDSYAYVAFGRMGAWYGENPYLHTLASLAQRGDGAAAFFPIDASSTYGPLWNLLASALAAQLRGVGLYGEVVAMKLVAASAGVAAALAGRRIAQIHAPAHADLALLAIGLNPLLLLEGAGNGHNDIVMIALLLWAVALHASGRAYACYLVLGLSAGIKFVSVALAPWLVLEQIAGLRPRAAARTLFVAAGLVLAPALVAFLPFWAGAEMFAGMGRVVELQTGGAGPSLLMGLVPAAVVYLALTVFVARSRMPGKASAAWVVFAGSLPFLALPSWFAWYLTWSCLLALTRWDRLHCALSAAGAVLSLLVMSMYAVPR